MGHIPNFTKRELQHAIDCLKKGTAGGTKGIKAEDHKECSDDTKEIKSGIFNEMIKQECMAPSSWKNDAERHLHKGDATKPEYYRPICTLPTL